MPSPGFTSVRELEGAVKAGTLSEADITRVPQKSQKSRQRPSWSVLDVTICSKTISQQRITTWHARWPKAPVCC